MANLRIPPQNLDAEKAVLGSIMLRPDALFEIVDIIIPDSFYADKHKIIFENVLDLSQKNEPIDLLTLSSRLKERKLLDSIGGSSYLTEIVNFVPASTNVRHYADIVNKKHTLRRMIEAAEHISEIGFNDGHEKIEELLDIAEKRIFDISLGPKNKSLIHIKDMLGETWDRIEKLHEHKGGLRGIKTGFRDLDNILSGLQKSDLIIIAARPSI